MISVISTMTENVALWLIGEALALIGIGIGAYFTITGKVSDIHLKLSERLVRIETTIDLLGENAAKILHSPHDPFKLDSLLDKYIDRHYEMSPDEWGQLLKQCEVVMNDHSVSKNERLLAGTLAAVCHHKLRHDPTDGMRPRMFLKEL